MLEKIFIWAYRKYARNRNEYNNFFPSGSIRNGKKKFRKFFKIFKKTLDSLTEI